MTSVTPATGERPTEPQLQPKATSAHLWPLPMGSGPTRRAEGGDEVSSEALILDDRVETSSRAKALEPVSRETAAVAPPQGRPGFSTTALRDERPKVETGSPIVKQVAKLGKASSELVQERVRTAPRPPQLPGKLTTTIVAVPMGTGGPASPAPRPRSRPQGDALFPPGALVASVLPTIQVTIGRVEVRASLPPSLKPSAPPRAGTSLEEFLNSRAKGGRR
jgi:hypothetical protein